jgi:hypothetical protein
MHTSHPAFRPPPDADGKIWQYMELAEFVNMLNRKALFFVKANKLRDPYEGIIPQYSNMIRSKRDNEEKKQYFQRLYESNNDYGLNRKVAQTMEEQFQMYRQLVLINPWHYNEYESAAMWSLYSHENAGIAIQSTTRRLSECFKDNNEDPIWIGKVQYLDFSVDWMNEWSNNLLQPFVTKRKSFEYEKEIRAVTCLPNDKVSRHLLANTATEESNIFSTREGTVNPKELTDKGKYVSADLHTLVEKVYVAPFAESWFEEVVESLLLKYDLDDVVTKSDLYTIS